MLLVISVKNDNSFQLCLCIVLLFFLMGGPMAACEDKQSPIFLVLSQCGTRILRIACEVGLSLMLPLVPFGTEHKHVYCIQTNYAFFIVQQLYQGTFHPPQDPPRLVPKCAPGCQFWYFRCSQESNIGEIWVSDDFCTTAWWKMEHFWNGG